MKLSTKGRYGLRAMVDLGLNGETEAVALSQISERQDISIRYLEQLIAKLRKAGLVISIRGAKGGYVLGKDSKDISVGEILRALEGDLTPVNCVEITDPATICSDSDQCVTKYVWKRISESINDAVDNIMLAELVEESKGLQNNGHTHHKDKSTRINCK